MDNSIWIKNATQHDPGMKFWPTLFSSYAACHGLGGVFTLCICLVPSQEYDFIIYLKMRLVFLYTLLGLPAAAHYQCLSTKLNFNSIQFNLTINGIKIQLKKKSNANW
jgi:hypothetical protein